MDSFFSDSNFQQTAHPREVYHLSSVNMITHAVTLRFSYHDEESESAAECSIGWSQALLSAL